MKASVNGSKAAGIISQRDVSLCNGSPGHYVESKYAAQGYQFHADTVFAVGTSHGYVANYVRLASDPESAVAKGAIMKLCVSP